MNKRKVKIDIAGRAYPLTIDASEEEAVRNAGKEINQLIQKFEERYAVGDKQDAIAMVALQMTSKLNLLQQTGAGNNQQLNEQLDQLCQFIDRELEKLNT